MAAVASAPVQLPLGHLDAVEVAFDGSGSSAARDWADDNRFSGQTPWVNEPILQSTFSCGAFVLRYVCVPFHHIQNNIRLRHRPSAEMDLPRIVCPKFPLECLPHSVDAYLSTEPSQACTKQW